MHKFSNKLVNETSPYLLQHAHNPVDWYPWGEEALQRARSEDKPILVSIGYAACHWCHVMERESFEDEQTARLMNENFINIKIDREERPDLDHIYMDAVQAMTGSGGWPLNVFLTPQAKPFFGGTYFPPVRAFNRSSWKETLEAVSRTFKEKRKEVEDQAENLTGHLVSSNSFGIQATARDEKLFSKDALNEMYENLMKNADREWGGFGRAPKFPQTFSIQFLLRYYHFMGHKPALDQALLSLDRMIEGGIYDQVGGGFARYSTDEEWLVPHFEKMLYDNALLIVALSEAYQITRLDRYKDVIVDTLAFITREMMSPEKGFYAALDADSEGEEGKFYVWTKEEVDEVLGADAALFCDYYDITWKGNWENVNILRTRTNLENYSHLKQIDGQRLKQVLEKGKEKLLERRSARVRPQLDDKIILGWNALMNFACGKAFSATGEESFRELAVQNMHFLLEKFTDRSSAEFYHTWKNGQAKYPAFLDDYAYLIQALISLQEITADPGWLIRAREITETVIEKFSEAGTGFFFYTKKDQADVIVRKKEVYDGAVPSGNAVMADVLFKLSILFDQREWGERARSMMLSLGPAVIKYPTSFGNWNRAVAELAAGIVEIAVTGKSAESLQLGVLKCFIPNKVFMATREPNNSFPLLAGKMPKNEGQIYVCRDFSCLEPTSSVERALQLIEAANHLN